MAFPDGIGDAHVSPTDVGILPDESLPAVHTNVTKRLVKTPKLYFLTAYPLEIKKTASPGRDDARHFRILEKRKIPVGPGGVICLAKQSLPLTPTVHSIPVAAL